MSFNPDTDIRALPFLQPWAHAVFALGKDVDNRARGDGGIPPLMRHRGPLLVHASQKCARRYYEEQVAWIRLNVEVFKDLSDNPAERSPLARAIFPGERGSARYLPYWRDVAKPYAAHTTQCGGILGQVRVVGVINPEGRLLADNDLMLNRDAGPVPEVHELRIRMCARGYAWHMPGQWGAVLSEPRLLPFYPCKGGRSLFSLRASELQAHWALEGIRVSWSRESGFGEPVVLSSGVDG